MPEQPEGEEFEPRLNIVPGGKVYVDQNMDRFGLPIRPMKPLNIIPGPGEYNAAVPFYKDGLTASFSKAPRTNKHKSVDPGPGSYEFSTYDKPSAPQAM